MPCMLLCHFQLCALGQDTPCLGLSLPSRSVTLWSRAEALRFWIRGTCLRVPTVSLTPQASCGLEQVATFQPECLIHKMEVVVVFT